MKRNIMHAFWPSRPSPGISRGGHINARPAAHHHPAGWSLTFPWVWVLTMLIQSLGRIVLSHLLHATLGW
jgi:hypothetical protein